MLSIQLRFIDNGLIKFNSLSLSLFLSLFREWRSFAAASAIAVPAATPIDCDEIKRHAEAIEFSNEPSETRRNMPTVN